MSKSRDKPMDLVKRGSKKPSPVGTSLFIGLRALDPFLQYAILSSTSVIPSFFEKVGLSAVGAGTAASTGITVLDRLNLSPHRLVLLSMATGCAAKNIFWVLVTAQEEFPPSAAIPVAVFNTIFNSANSLLFSCAATSAIWYTGEKSYGLTPLTVGAAMFTLGILTEPLAEWQRQRFKADPANAGKPYTGGLWQYARHINYGAYTLWRAGYALTSSGFTWAAAVGAFFFTDFVTRAVPILDDYCTGRYGMYWEEFKRKTPYILIPYVY